MRAVPGLLAAAMLVCGGVAQADAIQQTKGHWQDKFRQLEVDLPTPTDQRTASGAPGHAYWQQQADYRIKASLDAAAKRLTASAQIRYTNHSPDTLPYLWLQLDQNIYRPDSIANLSRTADRRDGQDRLGYEALARHQITRDIPYGVELAAVLDDQGSPLPHTVNGTMMRIDLPQPLGPGQSIGFRIDWAYNIINKDRIGGRSGYEHFPDTDSELFFIAQWFPRLAAYTDYGGWLNKQFLGRGEFTLEFGDYEVELTVPADHIVSATGELANPSQVLTPTQRRRLREARTASAPVFIVTPEEAAENEKVKDPGTRTWVFKARNVRDFAFASSNKFIWDAMLHRQDDPENPYVMLMSFYPNEAEPIWSKYSTHAVQHTLDVYNRFSFNYPYPTAQSVNTWSRGGMEYPMITFNGFRPEVDDKTGQRTWSSRTKAALIGVIIHEIGHIYFPMVVNSDERQWTWMDEGLNSFLQAVAELEWEETWGEHHENPNLPDTITDYMRGDDQVPVMTQSDSIRNFGWNAYTKPATALMILRETIMGRELFDHAFREYARRWKFKRPTPADFFRTLEDASAVDLDWFWRGWFYTTDHVDIALTDVREYTISTLDPEVENGLRREKDAAERARPLAVQRNRGEGLVPRVERVPGLTDFYNDNDPFTVTNKERNSYQETLEKLEPWEREALERALREGEYVYFLDFANEGGLVMPLPLELTFADGSTDFMMIPAEIWRMTPDRVTRMLIHPKRIVSVALDPRHEIADADRSDNHFPRRIQSSRIELYRQENDRGRNMMADMLVELRKAKDAATTPEGADVPLAPASPATPAPAGSAR